MSLYRRIITGEIRDLDDAWIAGLLAAGNPKALAWEAYAPPVVAPEAPQPHRVSKDTIIGRLDAAGKLEAARTILAAQTTLDQYRFTHSAWFWSDNAKLRGLCAHPSVALNPDDVLAPDEWLT